LVISAPCNLSAGGPIKKFNKTIQQNSIPYGKEMIDFIGFKNSRNIKTLDNLLKGFGATLSNTHIAVDRSDFYMGIFSLDELQLYKSTKRYVSFVEVNEFLYEYNDRYSYNVDMEVAGIILTAFCLIPIGVPLLIAADPNKTQMQLKGEMKFYLYDTQKKEIAMVTPLSFNYVDYYKGKYFHRKTDHASIDNYYRIFLSNLLLEKYVAMDNFIRSISE